jgi:hypothetical protein
MHELLTLLGHLLVTFAKLLRPGGVSAVAAESLLFRQEYLWIPGGEPIGNVIALDPVGG